MANETIDCSGAEQLSVCLRFAKDGKIYERLLQVMEATDLSDAGIASKLLNILQNVGIDPHFVIGQCYDGASAMSGQHNGVQKQIKGQCPTAIYTHCVFHRLNLCIVKACNVREIQACMSVMKDLSVFFSNSQKRLSLLHAQIDDKFPDSSHSRLNRHCSTRWIEHHDAVFVFKELYSAVAGSLDQLSESRDGEVVRRAMSYFKAITTLGFLVSLEVINAILNTTKAVAKKLHGIQETILTALNAIASSKDVIQAFRDNEEIFVGLIQTCRKSVWVIHTHASNCKPTSQ